MFLGAAPGAAQPLEEEAPPPLAEDVAPPAEVPSGASFTCICVCGHAWMCTYDLLITEQCADKQAHAYIHNNYETNKMPMH